MVNTSSLTLIEDDTANPRLAVTSSNHLYIVFNSFSQKPPLAVTLASGEHVLVETNYNDSIIGQFTEQAVAAADLTNNYYRLLFKIRTPDGEEELGLHDLPKESNWAFYTVSNTGILDRSSRVELSPDEYYQQEIIFNQDFNMDDIVALNTSSITPLVTDTAEPRLGNLAGVLYIKNGGVMVTFANGQPIHVNSSFEGPSGTTFTQTAIAVSQNMNGIYHALFKETESKNQTENVYYTIYSIAENGILDPDSSLKYREIKSQEIIFGQDLDGDGVMSYPLDNFTDAVNKLNELDFKGGSFVLKDKTGKNLTINTSTFINDIFNIKGVCFTELAWNEVKKLIVRNPNGAQPEGQAEPVDDAELTDEE